MYLYDKNRITYFAETDRRNKRVPFGIKADDRTRHMYIIGKTGMGKSTLIENLVVQDIKNGEGLAFIDPHGKSAAMLLDYIPEERLKDVVYFAPFDTDNPISFNVMEDVGPDKRHLIANGLMSAFKKIWGPDTWSDRMQYILANTLLALLEYPDSTLLGVIRMLTDKAYRKKVVDNVKDPSVKAYWVDEFAKYSEKYAQEATPAIQNKLGQFTSNPLIRNIIGQPHSSFDLRKMMDERKILIVNLSKGQLGEGNANLLGGMIITKIYLAAMSRADLNEVELKRLPNFYMYVDEFQSFANESFADILSEARKYKLALTVAHQYIKQMDEKVADAVFGNVGTQIMFRVGAPDAEVLEKEYAPVFTAEDMVSLGFTQIYLKLMIDGVASHPFSAVTLGPIAPPEKSLREEVIASSRVLYGHPRAQVEKNIADWYATGNETAHDAPDTRRVIADDRRTAPRVEALPRVSSTQSTPLATPRPNPSPAKTPFTPRESSPVSERRENSPERRADSRPHFAASEKDDRRAPQTEKFEKPFAQAFRGIQGGEVKPVVQGESPKMPIQARTEPRAPFSPIKSKGPTEESLSGLKAALAGVLTDLPATASSNSSGADSRWQAGEKKTP
ncbi:MAG: type IV secretion system DNA-binding domain-containing protein, partial [Minisyncoccia bacterium]